MVKKRSLLLFFIIPMVTGFSFQQEHPVSPRPNVLFIIVDQWRGAALGFLKKEPVLTPHLDKLASQSLVLTQTVTNYPLCSPSRAMWLTGRYPLKNKVYSNVNSNGTPYHIELPEKISCWSDELKANGYYNGYIGKWHLDAPDSPYVPTSNNKAVAWNEWTPPARRHGFDYWYSYGTYDLHNRPMYWDTHDSREDFHYVDQWGPEHETDKAIAFLKGQGRQNRPFSLVVSMNPPHSVYDQVPARYFERYKDIPVDSLVNYPDVPAAGTRWGDYYRKYIKYYYACMTGVDDQVGRLLQALDQEGLADNTIVVFMSDHGNQLGRHEEESKNIFYEESVSIPFIIRWNGHIKPAVDNRLLFTVTDIYPTLLDLLSIKNTADGKSYARYFLNRSGTLPAYQFLMGMVKPGNVDSGFRGIRSAAYKLAYLKKGGHTEPYLFDLANDPYEMENIYSKQPAKAKELSRQLQQWLTATGDPFTLP